MHQIQESLLALARQRDLSRTTLREIAKLIGRENISPAVLQHHFAQLEKKELLFIDRKAKVQRIGDEMEDKRFHAIPIVGAANCGPAAIFAEESIEGYLKISKNSLRTHSKQLIAIRASGNSMNRAAVPTIDRERKAPINDGDFVVVDTEQRSLDNNIGNYVLSVIGGMANIKKLAKRQYDVALLSESSDAKSYPPIILTEQDDVMINGRVLLVCEA